MNFKSVLIATFVSLGIYFIFKTISLSFMPAYELFSTDLDAASTALSLVKLFKYLGVFLACYIAIGLANRANAVHWQYAVYSIFIALPIVALAVFPDIERTTFPDLNDVINDVPRLIFYCLAAFVGLFLGIRFNQLKSI